MPDPTTVSGSFTIFDMINMCIGLQQIEEPSAELKSALIHLQSAVAKAISSIKVATIN